MGEESTRLKSEDPGMTVSTASGTMEAESGPGGKVEAEGKEVPAVEISRLRTEIDDTRDQLGTYITELDRRRHEALDLKLQVKRHPGLAIGAAAAVVGAAALGVVMVLRARKPENRRRRALARRASPPPAVPADPDWKLKFVLKAALPIGVALAKRFLIQPKAQRPRSA